jgi:PAS domain S-box-containing protein
MAADLLPDAIITIGLDSNIQYANLAAERLFGFDRGSMVGCSLVDAIIPPEMAAQHERGMKQYMKSRTGPVIGRRIEVVARDRAGRRFPIELAIFPDPATEGRIIHAQIREVSDRVAREAEFRAEREQLAQFLDATTEGWWDCEIGGATRYADRLTALQMEMGREATSVEPPLLPWIDRDDALRVRDAWQEHLDGRTARYECTYRVRAADGDTRWMRDRGRAVRFELGRPTRIVGTTSDVTEQQAAEEALANVKRLELLGLLAGGFAHDLNNLLTAIGGQADIASSEPSVAPAVLESLEAIRFATTKATMLTSNMLALGKPRESTVRRIALRPAIEDAMRLAAIGLNRAVRLVVDASAVDGFEVEMDPSALPQILLNLAVNARDAMPTGGTLRVEALPLEGRAATVAPLSVRIVVEDTGCGISEAALARVFEPFFTTKPKGVGTGLGLAVVRQAITAAHGRITVESTVGRGTRFIIELPAFVSKEQLVQVKPSRSLRVVVAEDHALLCAMLTESLRAAGHDVVDAGDGALALAQATHGERIADVLVLDVYVPSIDGFRVHAEAEARTSRQIGAVFITGEPGVVLPPGTPAHCELLFKPFEIQSLLEAVARVGAAVAR